MDQFCSEEEQFEHLFLIHESLIIFMNYHHYNESLFEHARDLNEPSF